MQASAADRIQAKSRYCEIAREFGRLVGGLIDAEDRELFWFAETVREI